ncbi:hypothetical protein [Carnobacterium maltaromaticum]|uniref:hypothetical protein n=1 Tax=Carnobacterium maltaromaticum TaxID=2751 RepID=UPI0012FBB94C|nr:hypothetical protein [Carnobacterium maltaromaticum]
MKFLVVTEVFTETENGEKTHIRFEQEHAETEDPITAVLMTGQEELAKNVSGEKIDSDKEEQEAIVGVYEVIGSKIGLYNHLIAINDFQNKASWGNKQLEKVQELEAKLATKSYK